MNNNKINIELSKVTQPTRSIMAEHEYQEEITALTSTINPTAVVVVIGGGIAGISVCTTMRKKLPHNTSIILVEPKSYVEIVWSSYRALFDSTIRDESIVELEGWTMKHNIQHIQASCTSLDEDSTVVLSNGQTLKPTITVVCSGAVCKWPALGRTPAIQPQPKSPQNINNKKPAPQTKIVTKQQRIEQLERDGQRLLNSSSILIVGGGLIGVETAGEIAYTAALQEKDVEITLVHSGESLVPEFKNHKRASKLCHKKLSKLGVNIILNDTVVVPPNKKKTTSPMNKQHQQQQGPITTFHLQKSNIEIQASSVIWTTGITSQNRQFLGKENLTKLGWIQVDDYFRILGNSKVFAFGDCCNLLPNTGSQILGSNTNILVHNIKTVLECGGGRGGNDAVAVPERKLRKALVQTENYIVTIGKKDGVALTPLGATGIGLPNLKNKNLFLNKIKKDLGLLEYYYNK
jgi:NADH dehydrogenase FAD-containing subunit